MGRGHRAFLAGLAAVLGAMASPAAAGASLGVLEDAGCISAASAIECEESADALSGISGTAMSADGNDLYLTGETFDAVIHLARDPASGRLTWGGCISGSNNISPCEKLTSAAWFGFRSGLDTPRDLALSSDGQDLYAVAQSGDSVVHFDREPTTGAIEFASCVTSDSESAAACDLVPDAAPDGVNTSLNGASAVVVSSDGETVYVGGGGDGTGGSHAIARFARNTPSGELTFEDCIGSLSSVTACEQMPNSRPSGTTALSAVLDLEISPSGDALFAASRSGDALIHFSVNDDGSGELGFEGCISDKQQIGCSDSSPEPDDVGPLSGLRAIEITDDGSFLYGAAGDTATVTGFALDKSTGAPTYVGCIGADTRASVCVPTPGAVHGGGINSPLSRLKDIALSPDGTWLYAAAEGSSSLVRFERDPLTGGLAFADCRSGDIATEACDQTADAGANAAGSVLNGAFSLAQGPGGEQLYLATFRSATVTTFASRMPANGFAIKRVARRPRHGDARVVVKVPGPGVIALARNARVRPQTRELAAGGRLRLALKPRGKARRALRRRGRTVVRAKLTFTPEWGEAKTKTRRVTLRQKRS